jgi:hypothetical protein
LLSALLPLLLALLPLLLALLALLLAFLLALLAPLLPTLLPVSPSSVSGSIVTSFPAAPAGLVAAASVSSAHAYLLLLSVHTTA